MFDILGFTETWLNTSIPTADLSFDSFAIPERKDRTGDSHGGLLLYVRDSLHYKRRTDLEPQGIECIWIEVTSNHNRFLFGLFYRPPNADRVYDSTIEDSFSLAFDLGYRDVVITGDFNFNTNNIRSHANLRSLCEQFSLTKCIDPLRRNISTFVFSTLQLQ